MNQDIISAKQYLRDCLRAIGNPVPPKTAGSGKVHLEVWLVGHRNRPAGFELGHEGVVNVWLTTMHTPKNLPDTIKVVRKIPKGRGWTDADGKGANSNLSAYDAFRTRPITRLGVETFEDMKQLMDQLI